MRDQKNSKQRRSYEPEFKGEILKMLVSGRKVREVSQTFGIAENLLYRWKTVAMMKTKTTSNKSKDSESSSKLVAENAKLKAEIERLKTDREILKKALGLLSTSD
jgi:transposase